MKFKNNKFKKYRSGFTLVELAAVIVIIAVLSTITYVGYAAAVDRAAAASVQSDLKNASGQLELFTFENRDAPTTVSTDCNAEPTTATNLCLKLSPGNELTTTPYVKSSKSSYTLTITNGDISYYVTESKKITEV